MDGEFLVLFSLNAYGLQYDTHVVQVRYLRRILALV
jgi:hypothetical protein